MPKPKVHQQIYVIEDDYGHVIKAYNTLRPAESWVQRHGGYVHTIPMTINTIPQVNQQARRARLRKGVEDGTL